MSQPMRPFTKAFKPLRAAGIKVSRTVCNRPSALRHQGRVFQASVFRETRVYCSIVGTLFGGGWILPSR